MYQYEFIEDLEKTIKNEICDAAYYEKLAEQAPNAQTRQTILNIAKDEKRHEQLFSKVYMTLTGTKPSKPARVDPQVPNYRTALRERIIAEIDTYEHYKDYYLQSNRLFYRDIFFDIMHDEAEHAMRLQLLLTESKAE